MYRFACRDVGKGVRDDCSAVDVVVTVVVVLIVVWL